MARSSHAARGAAEKSRARQSYQKLQSQRAQRVSAVHGSHRAAPQRAIVSHRAPRTSGFAAVAALPHMTRTAAGAVLACVLGSAGIVATAAVRGSQQVQLAQATSASAQPLASSSASSVSRSQTRDALSEKVSVDGTWSMAGLNDVNAQKVSAYDVDTLSKGTVSNKITSDGVSYQWLGDSPLSASAPARPTAQVNHDTGDSGNAYPFSQCTWWVYVRRHQLGLPVGSHFGNGAQWADSARALGYQVDHTPSVGAVMVFARGQLGASAQYGHVAVVEAVEDDGSVVTSESGAALHGKAVSRRIWNCDKFWFIHS